MLYQATVLFSVTGVVDMKMASLQVEVCFAYDTDNPHHEDLQDELYDEGLKRVKEVLKDTPGGDVVLENYEDWLVWPKRVSLNTIQ